MMLGQVIGVEAEPVVNLDDTQPLVIELAHRPAAAIEMIENPNFNLRHNVPTYFEPRDGVFEQAKIGILLGVERCLHHAELMLETHIGRHRIDIRHRVGPR